MNKYLSELKKFLVNYKKQTDKLSDLEARVDELLVEELMKDCLIHRHEIETTTSAESKYIKYFVKQDDFLHIVENLWLVQKSLPDDILIGANHLQGVKGDSEFDSYSVIFKMKVKGN